MTQHMLKRTGLEIAPDSRGNPNYVFFSIVPHKFRARCSLCRVPSATAKIRAELEGEILFHSQEYPIFGLQETRPVSLLDGVRASGW